MQNLFLIYFTMFSTALIIQRRMEE